MKIAFFMQGDNGGEPQVSTVMAELFDELERSGASLDLIVAESKSWDLSRVVPTHDLHVLKSKSPLTISLASILSEKGAKFFNSVASSHLAKDKIATAAALAKLGLPAPQSWTTGEGQCLQPLINGKAIWVKDRRGSKGQGVARIALPSDERIASNPADIYGLPLPYFAQRDVPSAGRDVKVYVVGNKQWAISRPWPALTAQDKQGEPIAVDEETRRIAKAAGKAMGLEIYGVDFLIAGNNRHIVDINAFPGFKGIPQAPKAIAQHLLAAGV